MTEERVATDCEKKEYEPPEAGMYSMEIRDITEVPSRFSEGEFQYKFKTSIWEQEGDAEDFVFWCSKKFVFGSMPSNLAKWVTGVVGIEKALAMDTFKIAEWINKPLQVLIVHKAKMAADGKTVEGYTAKVDTWMSPTKAHAAQAIQQEEMVSEEIPF